MSQTLITALGSRVVIIGNSGSGKSTLAQQIGRRASLPVTDLDRIHWQEGVGIKRDAQAAVAMVSELAAQPRWIIEGVYGWLADPALPRATALVWLDLPWELCLAGLQARGQWDGASDEAHADFLAWAADYWQRRTSTSFDGHLALFTGFAGCKTRIRLRDELAGLVGLPDGGHGDI